MKKRIISVQNIIIICLACLVVGAGVFVPISHFFLDTQHNAHTITYHVFDKHITISDAQSLHDMRLDIITALIEDGFDGFATRPFDPLLANGLISYQSGDLIIGSGDHLQNMESTQDAIDIFLEDRQKTQPVFESADQNGPLNTLVTIPYRQRSQWSDIILFKSLQDIEVLGYEVVSHRVRDNDDPAYRKHNIRQTFHQLGHVHVINPQSSLNFFDDVAFDGTSTRSLYKYGYGIFGDEVVPMYGGGICGASTAIYQGILTNTALAQEGRAHSKRYTHLYTAEINGEEVSIPGLDRTVYLPYLDLTLTNTASYPVVVILNFVDDKEEVFSLARPEHKGSFEYIGSHINKHRQRCYTRNINNEERISCYNNVY